MFLDVQNTGHLAVRDKNEEDNTEGPEFYKIMNGLNLIR